MKVERRRHMLYIGKKKNNDYPALSIIVAVLLLYLTPFTTSLLAIPATVICFYRVIRYDARVYTVDYCIIAPIIMLSRAGTGVPLMLYLSLAAAIRYFFHTGFRRKASYVILLILLNYLILRMQMDINSLVLCFGQIFMLCVLLPEQNAESAERAAKAFCLNLLIASVYSWIFRNHYAIREITGAESLAIWGTDITRFKGLFEDPNFYMTMLTVAIALLLKLNDSGRIQRGYFVFMLIGMTVFGILTYSKTFFLMFVLLVGIYLVWQFWNRKVFRGMVFTIIAVAALVLIFTMENSPFEVVLTRFRGANNISDLTTNRSDVYLMYLDEITKDFSTFFFGKGLAADGLSFDPHNLYIEIAYHIGVVGLLFFSAFHVALVWEMQKRTQKAPRQNIFAKYEVLLVVFTLYFTLHGIFQTIMYANFFLGYLSILMTKKQKSEEKLDYITEDGS